MDRLLPEPVLSLPLIVEQGKNIQQRGFSRPGRPHKGDELTLANFQIDATEYPGLPSRGFVAAFNILQSNHFTLASEIAVGTELLDPQGFSWIQMRGSPHRQPARCDGHQQK